MVAQYIHKSIDEQKKHSEIKILMKEKDHKPAPNESPSSPRTTGCREAASRVIEGTPCNSPIAVPRHARNHNPGGVCRCQIVYSWQLCEEDCDHCGFYY